MDNHASQGIRPSVLMISMPWTTLSEPSPGLGILKAVLSREGISCRAFHANLDILQHLHAYTYEALSVVFALNDFLFTGTLDGEPSNEQQRWLRHKVNELLNDGVIDEQRLGGSEGVVRTMLDLRNRIIPSWLDELTDEIVASDATLVGFTCMFDQTIASVALAKMVRERAPEKMIAFGGVAVRTPTAQMLLRTIPWIDTICDGDGEETIVALARASVGDVCLKDVPGLIVRDENGEPVSTKSPSMIDLNSIPTPDYDDYFVDIKRLAERRNVDIHPISLPVENSRGCWWGQKIHCIFCGIRDEDMAYRARDAKRTLEVLSDLNARYGMTSFRFSDYILPIRYFDTLLPDLADMGRPYRLSSEMKANITEDRFSKLAAAGFHEAQLGIESFSSDVLKKMHKGVSASQNVYSLLLGKRYGVRVLFNILYGFPDDELPAYEEMIGQLHNLIHLDPPISCVPVQITRFAPLEQSPERFGITRGGPAPSYALIFSRDFIRDTGFDMNDFCYYFERTFSNAPSLEKAYSRLNRVVERWRVAQQDKTSWLYRETLDGETIVHDKRGETEQVYTLTSDQVKLLERCESPINMRDLSATCMDLNDLESRLAELKNLGLIFTDEARVLSLLLPGVPPKINRPQPCRELNIELKPRDMRELATMSQ
ncbi:MAG: RiPP maturation radical SAM C-methyltransferase [Chthonomonadales bacterium]